MAYTGLNITLHLGAVFMVLLAPPLYPLTPPPPTCSFVCAHQTPEHPLIVELKWQTI